MVKVAKNGSTFQILAERKIYRKFRSETRFVRDRLAISLLWKPLHRNQKNCQIGGEILRFEQKLGVHSGKEKFISDFFQCARRRSFASFCLRSPESDEFLKRPYPLENCWLRPLQNKWEVALQKYEFECRDMSILWALFVISPVSGFWENQKDRYLFLSWFSKSRKLMTETE